MIAVFPGTFDPLTNGHLNLIERASRIMDKLFVVVSVNRQKKTLFSPEERMSFLCEATRDFENVEVHLWDKLIVDFAQARGVRTLLRGVRAFTDFGYEFELSMVNRGINPQIETFLLPTDPRYFVLRSSAIKELVQLGCDVSSMVPMIVEKALRSKAAAGQLH